MNKPKKGQQRQWHHQRSVFRKIIFKLLYVTVGHTFSLFGSLGISKAIVEADLWTTGSQKFFPVENSFSLCVELLIYKE